MEAFVGSSEAICKVRAALAKVATSEATVLILGETGTGKGHAARAIHALSRRAPRSFQHVDCASLAESVIESELFGHERGSFTGAHQQRPGRFELAAGGTVFLDEITEIDRRLQAKLLRVLQDRSFERVGGTRTLKMDARVLAATNQDIRRAVEGGSFRADLYFRLNVVTLFIPPLRERRADIPLLAQYQLEQLSNTPGLGRPQLSEAVLRDLVSYDWPGNIRELFNVVERLVTFSDPDSPSSVKEIVESLTGDQQVMATPMALDSSHGEADVQAKITTILTVTGGNVARAARRMGVARSTLRYWIKKYDLAALIPND